jgi:hypothetical protein
VFDLTNSGHNPESGFGHWPEKKLKITKEHFFRKLQKYHFGRKIVCENLAPKTFTPNSEKLS